MIRESFFNDEFFKIGIKLQPLKLDESMKMNEWIIPGTKTQMLNGAGLFTYKTG